MANDGSYKPMTPPLTTAEKIADAIVVGVLIFWFAFLGMVPQKGRTVAKPTRASDFDDIDRLAEEQDTEAA